MREPMTLQQVLGEAIQARVSALLDAKKAARAIEEAGTAAGVEEGPVPIEPDVLEWLPTIQSLKEDAEKTLVELAKELRALAKPEGAWHQTEHGPKWEVSPRGILLDRAAGYLEEVIERAQYARAAAEVLAVVREES